MADIPSNEEAAATVSTVVATKIFKEIGQDIIRHIELHPVSGEHPYEAVLRLGFAKYFMGNM